LLALHSDSVRTSTAASGVGHAGTVAVRMEEGLIWVKFRFGGKQDGVPKPYGVSVPASQGPPEMRVEPVGVGLQPREEAERLHRLPDVHVAAIDHAASDAARRGQ
jgi:hypothetical protein